MVDEVEKSAWNLSQQVIFQIANLLQHASYHFVHGRLDKCYWSTREIRMLIHADLTVDEVKSLKTFERSINKNKYNQNLSNYYLSEYREQVINMLSKYGYLVAKKQDATRMFKK